MPPFAKKIDKKVETIAAADPGLLGDEQTPLGKEALAIGSNETAA